MSAHDCRHGDCEEFAAFDVLVRATGLGHVEFTVANDAVGRHRPRSF